MSRAGCCPRCKSTYYLPDPANGGAGRNWCRHCNYRGPVRDFYLDATPTPLLGGRIAALPFTDNLRTETPAAPILQYKDD